MTSLVSTVPANKKQVRARVSEGDGGREGGAAENQDPVKGWLFRSCWRRSGHHWTFLLKSDLCSRMLTCPWTMQGKLHLLQANGRIVATLLYTGQYTHKPCLHINYHPVRPCRRVRHHSFGCVRKPYCLSTVQPCQSIVEWS
jgi:hypothetical protein